MADTASPKLATSQANALVYSTLVGFGLVGVYAGWRVKSKMDFLSGLRTQSGGYKWSRDTVDRGRWSGGDGPCLPYFADSNVPLLLLLFCAMPIQRSRLPSTG